LLQAPGKDTARMVDSKVVRKRGRTGLRFQAGTDTWEVLFATEGGAAGHIRLRRNGKTAVDRELTRSVMPQQGIAYVQ
ncbi:MAG: hypothetical protein NTY38_29520, partial [Acidobacteria bacterium]|nr:hypothetical protein [Acidobacteriota bacterium]